MRGVEQPQDEGIGPDEIEDQGKRKKNRGHDHQPFLPPRPTHERRPRTQKGVTVAGITVRASALAETSSRGGIPKTYSAGRRSRVT